MNLEIENLNAQLGDKIRTITKMVAELNYSEGQYTHLSDEVNTLTQDIQKLQYDLKYSRSRETTNEEK